MSKQDDRREQGAWWVMFEALYNGGNTGKAIEAQEAKGQQSFVASDLLPRDMGGKSIQDVTALGFVFGDDDSDPLFLRCQYPTGWKKVATEHSMWSNIVDGDGVIRAQVFYKAAFYDERAFVRFND